MADPGRPVLGRVIPDLLRASLRAARPRRLRPMLQWAEEELRIPEGPRRGLPFSADFMPFDRLLLAEYDNPRWRRFVLAGSVQSGKTLRGFVIPTLYYLFEAGENVIDGLPNVDLAQDLWDDRLHPVIRWTRYRALLPSRGAGSRGGRSIYRRFGNGAILRFMSAGGRDTARIGRSSRVICVTEADQCATDRESSLEATPIQQFEARSTAYGDSARFFAECVVHTRDHWIWRAVAEEGSDGRVFIRCPHCSRWLYPERQHFHGWQDANTETEARRDGRYICQLCAVAWTEGDRQAACAAPRLVHRGQGVDAAGRVTGPLPETRTFALRWNCIHSPFILMSEVGAREWLAARSERPEDEQELCQFWWAEPYAESATEANQLTANAVRERVNAWPRGVVPPSATVVTMFLDVMKRYAYWALVAWEPGVTGWVVDYGVRDVIEGQRSESEAIIAALTEFGEEFLAAGWPVGQLRAPDAPEGAPAAPRLPDIIGLDSRWQTDAVFEACRQLSGRAGRILFWPCMGDGTAPGQQRYRQPRPDARHRVVRPHWHQGMDEVRRMWLTHLDADHWKNFAQGLFLSARGSPGGLTLFRPASAMQHNSFAQHMVSEKKTSQYVAGKGLVTGFAREGRKANHWLDCMAGCCALADVQGISELPAPAPAGGPGGYARAREGAPGWKIGR
ncbi:MAG: terminase gpA endonuclease subunit [Gemmatimonadota bacterium]